MPLNTLNRHPSHKSRLSLQYTRTAVSDVQERSHNRASSVQDGQVQQSSTSIPNAPGVPTTSNNSPTSKIPTKIPQRRPSSSSLSSQTSSKKSSSSMGLKGMIKRTSSKLIGKDEKKSASTTALSTPTGAPLTPPPSSRGTPASTLSRFRSRDSRPGSSNSFHSLETDGQQQQQVEAPTSVPHKINTITPPVSMLQLAENEAKEYFATSDGSSDHHSDKDVQSIPEEVEEEDLEETAALKPVVSQAETSANMTFSSARSTNGSFRETSTNTSTADTTKETIFHDTTEEEPKKKEVEKATGKTKEVGQPEKIEEVKHIEIEVEEPVQPVQSVKAAQTEQPKEEKKDTEVVVEKARGVDPFDVSKIEVDESFVVGHSITRALRYAESDDQSIIEVADSVYELDLEKEEDKKPETKEEDKKSETKTVTKQASREPITETKHEETTSEVVQPPVEIVQRPKENQLVKDSQLEEEEEYEELVIPNGASTPKEGRSPRPVRLHMDFNLDRDQGTFEILAEQSEGEESEDDAQGRKIIEDAKRTLEMLEAQNKPKSPHGDPMEDSFDYSQVSIGGSSAIEDDDEEASVVSDFHQPRVSDAISKFEKDIEISQAVAAPMRSRTTSYSSNSFHAGMGAPPNILVRTDSAASSPEQRRPLSRSLSISSTFRVSSRSPSRNGDRSLNSFFIKQGDSPTTSHFDFSDRKKRGPSSVYSVGSSTIQQSASNESLGRSYRFASPTLASSTREQITKTEYEHILSEKDKPKPERPDLRKKTAASSAGEYVSKRSIRVRLPGGGSSTPGDLTPSRSREQFFNPDSSYMSLADLKAPSPTPSVYATTATQTESPYPSPPESPTLFEPAPPRLRRMSTSSRRSFRGEVQDEPETDEEAVEEDVGIDAKVASLLSMFDEDARTVEELVGSLESSMSMLEKESGRRSRSNSVHSLHRSRMHSRAASSVGSGVSRRSRGRSLYGDDDSDRSRDFPSGSVRSVLSGSTKVDESQYISELRRRNLHMRDSPPISPTPPRTPVDADMQKGKHMVHKPFTPTDIVTVPVKWVSDNKGTLFMATLIAVFLLFLYYMQLIKIHRECGFADTYVCTSGGRVCLMRPYRCY